MRRLGVFALLFGCAGLSGETSPGDADAGGTAADGGAFVGDGSSPTLDAASPPSIGPFTFPAASDRSEADSFEGASGVDARSRCFDEVDNDGSGAVDCDTSECRTLASCCLDRGDCCVPRVSDLPTLEDFTCGSLARCFGESAEPFGSPAPFIVSDGLAGGADARFDSGLLVGAPIELATTRIRLSATFARTPCADELCVASFAVGLTADTTLGDEEHVAPLVAMQVSAARDGVALLAMGREVARVAWVEGATWTLTASPEGHVELIRDGTPVASARVSPQRARVVLFGHATNPSATEETSAPRVVLTSLNASVATCDMVRAFDAPEPLVVFDGASPATFEQVTDVTLAEREGARWLAFTDRTDGVDRLHVARDQMGFALAPDVLPNVHANDQFPTLAFDAAGRLFLVARHTPAPDGALSEEQGPRLVALRFDEVTETFVPDETLALDTLPADPASLSEPSLVFHRDHAILVTRAALDGTDALQLFVRGPLTGAAWRDLGSVPGLSAVASPSFVVHHDVYLLHYTWRRGTRGVVGVAASDELVAWRSVAEELLESAAFDRLGARAVSARSDSDSLELVYVADDGVRQRLARRTRPAPPGGAFEGGAR